MANGRLSMRKIKELLRLHQEIRLSERQIAESCGISQSTVEEYLHRAQRAGLSFHKFRDCPPYLGPKWVYARSIIQELQFHAFTIL